MNTELEKTLDRFIWIEEGDEAQVAERLAQLNTAERKEVKAFVAIQRGFAKDYADHVLTQARGEKALQICHKLEALL